MPSDRIIGFKSDAAKIFMRVIHNRLQRKCEEHLDQSECDFRKGSTTREAMFGLYILAERHLEVQKDLYVFFVHYQKASDRIRQEHLVIALKLEFELILRVARQECRLFPILFNARKAYHQ